MIEKNPSAARGLALAALLALLPLGWAPPLAGQEALPGQTNPAGAQGEELMLLRLPQPALAGLEPAVRDQLQEAVSRLGLAAAAGGAQARGAGAEVAASRRELAERFGELGHLYHAYELWPSAEAAYENARRLEPGEVSWTWSLAVAAFRQGQSVKAKRLFEDSLRLAPGQPAAALYLGEIALQEGDAAKASELAFEVLQQLPASPAALFLFGRAALLAEQPKDAIPPLELALEQVPEASRIHYLLAMARRATGDAEGAKREMALAGPVGVKIPDPLDPVLASHRRGERVPTIEGDLAMNAGRFAEAAAAYRRALEAQPKNAELWTKLGAARASGGDYAGGESDLRRALELDPFLPVALRQLGRLLTFQQKWAESLPFFERLIDLEPDGAAGRRELGLALNALGRRQEALDQLRKVVLAQPQDEEARLGAAVAAVELGRFAEGRDLLEAGLAIDPAQGRLVRAMARLLAAVPALELRDGPRAVALAEQLVRTTGLPQDQEILALALAEAGRCGEAAELYDRLAREAPPAGRPALAARASAARNAKECRPPGGTR